MPKFFALSVCILTYMCTYTDDNCDFSYFYDPISIKKKESKLSISLYLSLSFFSENTTLYIYVFAYIEINRDFGSVYDPIFI